MNNYTEISYIYGLKSSSNNIIRYIGYSKNPKARLRSHICESKRLKYYKHKWIQFELLKGNTINMEILRCVKLESINECEIETILLFKSLGAKLVNSNNGGKGTYSPIKEVREKMSSTKKGIKWKEGRVASKLVIENGKKLGKRPKTEKQILSIINCTKGKPNIRRRYSEEIIIEIFKMYNENFSILEISKKLNILFATIHNTLFKENNYRDIKSKYNLKINK
jgi:hypothetical protein